MDEGAFSYSLDGKSWQTLGNKVPLVYTAPHFTGYRFGIFMYSTQEAGGFADFDGVAFKWEMQPSGACAVRGAAAIVILSGDAPRRLKMIDC